MAAVDIYCPNCGEWTENAFGEDETLYLCPGAFGWTCPKCRQSFSIQQEYFHEDDEGENVSPG